MSGLDQLNRMEIATAIGALREGARTSRKHRFQDEANRQDHVADVLTHHLMRRKVGNAGGLGTRVGTARRDRVASTAPGPSGASDQGAPPHSAGGGSEAAPARPGTLAPVGRTRGVA